MNENSGRAPQEALSWLLEGALRGRIAILLWRQYPKALTVDEINDSLPRLSKSRIQQVLQKMYENGAIERSLRETGKPGPNPFQYKLNPLINRVFNDGLK